VLSSLPPISTVPYPTLDHCSGAGSISAPLIMCSEEPLALGKPSQAMMDAIEGNSI